MASELAEAGMGAADLDRRRVEDGDAAPPQPDRHRPRGDGDGEQHEAQRGVDEVLGDGPVGTYHTADDADHGEGQESGEAEGGDDTAP